MKKHNRLKEFLIASFVLIFGIIGIISIPIFAYTNYKQGKQIETMSRDLEQNRLYIVKLQKDSAILRNANQRFIDSLLITN